jgi:hypothetical protein
MANLKEWLLEMANGDEILSVVIGEMGWGSFQKELVPNYDKIPKGQILPWEQAQGWLDFEFDRGFGAPECPAVYAWTESIVIAIGQYNGSTWPYTIPRNPEDIMPEMQGR